METPTWNSDKFVADFIRSECYQKPLELEEGRDGIFLETSYEIRDNNIHYKLKNDNEDDPNKIWRYHHWHSITTVRQKVSTLHACLQKANKASTTQDIFASAMAKVVAEFRRLRYPLHVLRRACTRTGAVSGEGTWTNVARSLRA